MYMWLTRENEGYCKNDKEATEETDTESCPGQSRLSQVKRKTEFNKYTDTGLYYILDIKNQIIFQLQIEIVRSIVIRHYSSQAWQ